MFAALGRFTYRRRWWVAAVWAAAFAAALAAATRLPGEFKSSAFVDPDAPSQRALLLMQERVGNGMSRVTILFSSETLEARSEEFQAAQAEALSGYTKDAFPDLNSVQTYASTVDDRFISKDGHTSLTWLVFDVPVDELEQRVPEVKAALQPSVLTTHVTGEAAVIRDLEAVSAADVRRAESVLFPIALVLLLLVFGSVFAATLPIAGGGASVALTLGVLTALTQLRDLTEFSVSIAALLGLGEGIIYSLLIVSRFREELRRGRSVPRGRRGDDGPRRLGDPHLGDDRRHLPARPRELSVHVAQLARRRRFAGRRLLGPGGADPAAGAARHHRDAGQQLARPLAARARGTFARTLVAADRSAPPGRRSSPASPWCSCSPGRSWRSRVTSPTPARCRRAPSRGSAMG